MSVRKSQQNAVAKYNAANYDRLGIVVPKGHKAVIQAAAAAAGQSVNSYVVAAVNERIERETTHEADMQEHTP